MPTDPKHSPVKEPVKQPAEHFPRKDEDPDLVKRPDNVGQSGRWRREDGLDTETERGGYGNEEAEHSTDQGWPEPGSTGN
jgi:hypothetical protein